MSDAETLSAPAVNEPAAASGGATPKKDKKEDNFFVFLIKLIVVVVLFRTFVFTSFVIPSGSMMPRLLVGDYLFAAKWPYGYSQASMPFDIKLWDGRIPAGVPKQGDVVIFRHPVDRADYVKRVIGLPGDQVQMVGGVLQINGKAVPKKRVADFELPIAPDQGCNRVEFTQRRPDGSFVCRYPQFLETLPNGKSYNVLDYGLYSQDTTEPVVVPEGRLFVMGDNRDDSLDSRFPPEAEKGVGLVPIDNVAGRASFMFFSTDGTAEWIKPWTWFTAARWSRIGKGF